MVDKIDDAIAGVQASQDPGNAPGDESKRHTLTLTLERSGGRHVILNFPIDLSDAEVLEWMGFLGTQLAAAFAVERAKAAGTKIEVVRSMPAGLTK